MRGVSGAVDVAPDADLSTGAAAGAAADGQLFPVRAPVTLVHADEDGHWLRGAGKPDTVIRDR